MSPGVGPATGKRPGDRVREGRAGRGRAGTCLALAFALVAATACRRQPDPEALETVDAWLLCEDLCDPERDAVRALGAEALGPLSETLLRSAPGEGLERRTALLEVYDETVSDAQLGEADFVSFYESNRAAVARRRAAVALGDLAASGVPAARDTLARALDLHRQAPGRFREDVVREIRIELARAGAGPPGGGILPASGGFLDTLTVGAGLGFDGDELVTLHGSPFGDDLIVERWPDSVAFVVVGRLGPHLLEVANLDPPTERQVADFAIDAFDYTPNGRLSHFRLGGGGPEQAYLAVDDARPAAYFGLTSGFAGRVIAERDGFAHTGVRRLGTCPASPIPATVVAGAVVDDRGEAVGGANVGVVGTNLGAITGPDGSFEIGTQGTQPVEIEVSAPGHRAATTTVTPGSGDTIVGLVRVTANELDLPSTDTLDVSLGPSECAILQVYKADRGSPPAIVRLRVEAAGADLDPPVIDVTAPPVGVGATDATAVVLSIAGSIDDQTPLTRAFIDVLADGQDASGDGANGDCDPGADHRLDPTGGEIDRNTVDLVNGTNHIDFAESFQIAEPPHGSEQTTVRYCVVVIAEDDAQASGAPGNLIAREPVPVTVTWNP